MSKLVEELKWPFAQCPVEGQGRVEGKDKTVFIWLAGEAFITAGELARERCERLWLESLLASP
ncbi:hypothetical protein PCO82_15155 [Pectobacteriaceae bacterium CE90]|nr:hypothetical protein PCO82_15155 [Pectobacteriaceae bacterium CE90]